MQYRYEQSGTSGLTGYYTCVPDPDHGLSQGLEMLEARPLDTFLHRHLLSKVMDLEPAAFAELAQSWKERRGRALATLLLEAAKISPECGKIVLQLETELENAIQAPHEVTPDLPLDVNVTLKEHFYANIHSHIPLPPEVTLPDRELKAKGKLIRGREGILARIHAAQNGAAQPPVSEDAQKTCERALAALEKTGIRVGREMRHEASLSPIALVRSWQVTGGVGSGIQSHTYCGEARAFGKGLSLAQARVSCVMEIVERACAHGLATDGRIGGHSLVRASFQELAAVGHRALEPAIFGAIGDVNSIPFYWVEGATAKGASFYVPAQATWLFLNLDEPALFETVGSTGLGAGATDAQARLAALTEVLERDANATQPFFPSACFELVSSDPVIGALLEDYRWRGIHVQFQDITTEIGIPAYRCFVQGRDGRIAQATAAALCGAKAALGALLETPWPYRWAVPAPAPSAPGIPDLPIKRLEELPDYGTGSYSGDLALLEAVLQEADLEPVYVSLARPELAFPVYRAFVPGLAVDPELEAGPSARLLARIKG